MASLNELIFEIKRKKELSQIEESVVLAILEKQLTKRNISPTNLNSKQKKELVKKIRAELRLLTGRFEKKASNLRKEYKKLSENKEWNKILTSHSSTKERIEADGYKIIKKIISKYKISSILDLGCGVNPLAIAKRDIYYTAIDINNSELEIVKSFFRVNKIKGNIYAQDIRHTENFPSVDLCFLLKLLDVIEAKGHKLAEKIIKSLNCKYILISFSTKTLSGKSMNHPQRGWIERLLTRLNIPYKLFKTPNEIFYFASR